MDSDFFDTAAYCYSVKVAGFDTSLAAHSTKFLNDTCSAIRYTEKTSQIGGCKHVLS